jgi:hypothetical protein
MLWRQGDVLIETTPEIPAGAHQLHTAVLVYGEATGHAHRVESPERAEVWEVNGQLYLKVTDATRLIHDEHLPITLAPGLYHVWQQREYTPQAIVRVRD